jgi:predicted permease
VEKVGGINHAPIAGDLWDRNLEIEGRAKPRPGEAPDAVYRIAWPGYFETMQLPILHGRAIDYSDGAKAPAVVIINKQAAERFWPGENPIGKRVRLQSGDGNWLTVIGVTANARLDDMESAPYPEIYLAALQTPEFLGEGTGAAGPHMSYMTVVLRSSASAAELMPQVRRVVESFDRALPISQVLTMDEAIAVATAQPRFEMWLLAAFAALAMLLAAVGIYGVMNYAVAQRTREIGIRMSLGAGRSEIMRMVLSQGLKQALVGVLAGVVAAALLARLMVHMLFAVEPTDPVTFVGVSAVLVATALAAIAIPARRATRIEPVVALRTE